MGQDVVKDVQHIQHIQHVTTVVHPKDGIVEIVLSPTVELAQYEYLQAVGRWNNGCLVSDDYALDENPFQCGDGKGGDGACIYLTDLNHHDRYDGMGYMEDGTSDHESREANQV